MQSVPMLACLSAMLLRTCDCKVCSAHHACMWFIEALEGCDHCMSGCKPVQMPVIAAAFAMPGGCHCFKPGPQQGAMLWQ